MKLARAHRRLIVPEVVQTSEMDCGPASLKCVLEGFGIPVSYGRLREACQTDLDGSSVDTLEEVAVQLGLDAQQIMLPADSLLFPEVGALPAIVVVRLPKGITHFVVVWRRLGPVVQVMDPATGRRWPTCEQFISSLHIHNQLVPAPAWREWATSEQFTAPLQRKLTGLGLTQPSIIGLLESASAAKGWFSLAALEASTRTVDALVRSGGLARGKESARVLDRLFEKARHNPESKAIPSTNWSVRAGPTGADGEEQVLLRGAVLVRVLERSAVAREFRGTSQPTDKPPLSPELEAALEEPPSRPWYELLRLLRADGTLFPAVICGALLLAAAGVIVEAILFRSLLDLSQQLGLSGQRLGALTALVLFLGSLLLLEFPIVAGQLRMGRNLESRLRIAFLRKIPRLGDRYFHSRLNSDMAERSHAIHRIRQLPELGGRLLRFSFELILTTAAIIWLDPYAAPFALTAMVLALAVPLLAQPALAERDLRLRSHLGALGRFYLDAFLGLVPVRTHGAERALRRENDGLLMEWARAGLGLQRLVVWVEALQFLAGFALAACLMLDHMRRFGESGGALLLVYWALSLPVLGQEVAFILWQYPARRNITLRLLEPLGALEEATADQSQTFPQTAQGRAGQSGGVRVEFQNVSVRTAGHTILKDIDLAIDAGSHVAIVGVSGAGKSSLVDILLGWHRVADGKVIVDGAALDGATLERLRRETAWVEPAVQLWNRTLFDNLRYGAPADSLPTGALLEQANLRGLVEKLSAGLQTELGEGGALVSGGEGQRVRLARALLKPGVRLAILDEPFRGLDRRQRRGLLARARKHWQDVTVICITHDVSETLAFPRVLVVEEGRIVEDGVPAELAGRSDSRYRGLLEAEDAVRNDLWSSSNWRQLRLEEGRLTETANRRLQA